MNLLTFEGFWPILYSETRPRSGSFVGGTKGIVSFFCALILLGRDPVHRRLRISQRPFRCRNPAREIEAAQSTH